MIVSVIALLAAGVAASDVPPPSSAPPPKPATLASKGSDQDKQNQIICKTEIPTGSRLGGVRECHTKAQWDEQTRQAREATENQQAQGINNGGK
jgi:hypothetical protein